MTRVLHVLDHSLPLHSGYTFRTRAILKAQEALGLEVRAITGQRHNVEKGSGAGRENPEIADGLTFHRTPGVPSGPPLLAEIGEIRALAGAIRRLAREWRPDVLHAHSPALGGAAALIAGRALGVPVVYEVRAFWEDAAVGNGTGREGSVKYRLTRALETHVARRADALFTICKGLKGDLVGRGIPEERIGVMPNGVDMALFGKPPVYDEALARRLGIPKFTPVIGYVGSFYDYEGLDDLIEAVRLLREGTYYEDEDSDEWADVRLLLVGGGPMEESLRAQAAALPERHRDAIIFTGRVPHEQVERYYSLISLLAFPRKKSRLTDLVTPLKPLEAMAQGLVVAASRVGGHEELITDQVTGFLFPPGDPVGCAQELSGALHHYEGTWPDLNPHVDWWDIKESGAAHVRENHDWARNARRYPAVYQELLTAGG
ncbi:MAG: glycosyltransferase, exosortase A system-associated [Erythrobacter sp.]|uniref:TIGR04063 family PEP-CTERM/XrtA system glycosyltransferase n=1 Tax=Erythrobacter sp. TaxID=1042 RepID=UPI0032EAF83B